MWLQRASYEYEFLAGQESLGRTGEATLQTRAFRCFRCRIEVEEFGTHNYPGVDVDASLVFGWRQSVNYCNGCEEGHSSWRHRYGGGQRIG